VSFPVDKQRQNCYFLFDIPFGVILFRGDRARIAPITIQIIGRNNLLKIDPPMDDSEELKFKVIVVGDVSVGKTSLVRRQAFNSFEFKMESTVGIDHLTTHIHVQDQAVKLLLWDTAGQEQYKSLVPIYSRGAHVCIIVASLVDPESVAHIEMWQEKVHDENKDVPIIVAINKTDMREGAPMTMDAIREKCQPLFPDIFFVSARTGDLVLQLFQQVARVALHGPGWYDDNSPVPADSKQCC
jgi:small GTP-binding protein